MIGEKSPQHPLKQERDKLKPFSCWSFARSHRWGSFLFLIFGSNRLLHKFSVAPYSDTEIPLICFNKRSSETAVWTSYFSVQRFLSRFVVSQATLNHNLI